MTQTLLTTTVRYRVLCPDVKGNDLTFPTRTAADREVAACRKAGITATVDEVLIRCH